jgi:serine/threonine protein kinase
MATVYSAKDADEVACAIKFLRSELADEALVRRFARETKLTATLEHRHLVPVLDAGVDGAVPFLVMPLCEGTDLGNLLGEVATLPPMTAVRIAIQACEGLEALHRAGIVHRDVKPRNILLAQHPDGEVVARICDFGIAKPLSIEEHTQLTTTGVELGSPLFMSPEQARDSKHVDERGDVFSLAATLYKALTGRLPHDASVGLAAYLLSLTRGEITPIQDLAPWIAPELAVVIHRALDRNPKRRWQTAAEFAAALRPFAGDSLALTEDMLRPLADDERNVVAERAVLPRFEDSVTRTAATLGPVGSDKRLANLDALVGRELGGKYRVVGVIGRGGMGVVLEVRTPDDQPAAAKVIDRQVVGEDEQTLVRFVREAKAAATIDSRHVVKTIDIAHDEILQAPFIVMELLRGLDLRTLFKQRAPVVPAALVRAFIQAGRGLAAAHAQGIVHRDIKPANLFAHEDDAAGGVVMKLCDFGVAKRSPVETEHDSISQDLTQTGGLLGSPMYMSPEQAMNAKNVDYRTDIWSLSISLYEGLTGRKVWAGRSTLGEIILAICTHPIPPLRQVAPWIEAGLAEVVHRGLEENPQNRWGSVEEMITALEPFAEGTLELGPDDLSSVSAALRAQLVTPLPPPVRRRAGRYDDAPTVGGISRDGTGAKTRAWHIVAVSVGAAALAAVALASGVANKRDEGVGPAFAPAPSGATSAATPANLSARVQVVPEGASVVVDGAARAIVAGALVLDGHVGQTFEVVATAAGVEARQRVVLSRDGQAIPDRIEVPAPRADDASKPRPTGSPPKTSAEPHPTATAAARPSASAPPVPPGAAEPTFKDTW